MAFLKMCVLNIIEYLFTSKLVANMTLSFTENVVLQTSLSSMCCRLEVTVKCIHLYLSLFSIVAVFTTSSFIFKKLTIIDLQGILMGSSWPQPCVFILFYKIQIWHSHFFQVVFTNVILYCNREVWFNICELHQQ